LQSLTQYWRFVMGAILAVIVISLPGGITGLVGDIERYFTPEQRL